MPVIGYYFEIIRYSSGKLILKSMQEISEISFLMEVNGPLIKMEKLCSQDIWDWLGEGEVTD